MTVLQGWSARAGNILRHLVALAFAVALLGAPLTPGNSSSTVEPVGLEAPAQLVLGQLTRLSSASYAGPFRSFAGIPGLLFGVTVGLVAGWIRRRALAVGSGSFKRWKRWQRLQLEGG